MPSVGHHSRMLVFVIFNSFFETFQLHQMKYRPSIRNRAVCSKQPFLNGTFDVTWRAPSGAVAAARHSAGAHRAALSNVPLHTQRLEPNGV